MPEVSIIMPTYNRADTIGRAIDSVRRQTFQDWELIIVDDGSTDGTASLVEGLDPRVRLIRQENAGCYVARNNGLRNSRGRYLTFIDSDDEWLPYFLEITLAFLKWSPEDQFVMTEFLEDWGVGSRVRHDIYEISNKFPRMARTVGSQLVELPPGESDNYLRVYDTSEPLGDWGRNIAVRAGYSDAALYRGHIFEYLRFRHLGWLPITILTRKALDTIGLFPENYRTAADYRFLGLLYRNFRANMISLPGAIKHNKAVGGRDLAEAHLATGVNEYRYAVHRLPLFDELFWNERKTDPEIKRIRGLYQYYAGRTALEHGKRKEALVHLREASDAVPGLWQARWLGLFVRIIPSIRIASGLYCFNLYLRYVVGRITSEGLGPIDLTRLAVRKLFSGVRRLKARAKQ
ncbi:MAG: glycosyltransferase [Sulfuricaulis sp.]|uniref:glycosyltransferase family 2 protein n=1 Tax=Sulfuricaulis sp. TaxID=2003553 RepID=UPI0025DEC023|nr:glycosyltransferase family 2 protein [Sulfuricaulis sp.]MCR4347472.1 glycosyltransferase [Sulfuricaulis sp.]